MHKWVTPNCHETWKCAQNVQKARTVVLDVNWNTAEIVMIWYSKSWKQEHSSKCFGASRIVKSIRPRLFGLQLFENGEENSTLATHDQYAAQKTQEESVKRDHGKRRVPEHVAALFNDFHNVRIQKGSMSFCCLWKVDPERKIVFWSWKTIFCRIQL